MTYAFWRLSEAGPANLGVAFTDDGLLLGHTSLIERREGRYAVRERHDIERLLKCAYHGPIPMDRLMAGLERVASALNAKDHFPRGSRRCSWRFPIWEAWQRARRWRRKIR